MTNKRKNKDFNPFNCGVTHFLNKVGGKWKVLVIHGINQGANRFSILKRAIPQMSKQSLINQLRELEDDGIIKRKVLPAVPPHVEYSITAYGKKILPVIKIIQKWGLADMKKS